MKTKAIARQNHLRKKLMAALAMLLVASIMMVTSTYAWYVMSTAPEVTGVQTQVGANGALEIALLNSDSWNNLNLLDMGDIDENAEELNVDANLTWGNIVNLSSSTYGLSQITLNPSRLYIQRDGNGYKINSAILKTPIYGEDGRISGLDKDSTMSFIYQNGRFDTLGYGVRAIGTAASMSYYQLGMNGSKNAIINHSGVARTLATNTLNATGGRLAGIVMDYAVASKTDGFTDSDVQAVVELAEGLQSSLGSVENALRSAFAGYLTTDGALGEGDSYEDALAQINDASNSLSSLLTAYPGITTVIPGMSTYITKLNSDQATVASTISQGESLIASKDSFTWAEVSGLVRPLMDTDRVTMGGMTMDEVRDYVMPGGTVDYSKALELLSGGGVTLTVPSGSGILSDIADFAGDYSASVTIEGFTYGSIGPMNINATMVTAGSKPSHLSTCSTSLGGAPIADAAGSTAITDYYGYAIDLAFRTNAETSNLLLQTEGVQRIYTDSDNARTQGSGSYMEFGTNAGLSATKMVKLMSGIRVVFMDEEQQVLAVAKLDCTLGQDAYTELSSEEKTETGMFAYLTGSGGGYQISDLISHDEYLTLPENSEVVFQGGRVRAALKTCFFSLTTAGEDDHLTGGMTAGDFSNNVITALRQDVVQRVTAVVYLDGSFVNNAMVAANATQSMTGTLNLQFSSSAELIPMENTALRGGSGEETATVSKAQFGAAITAIKADALYTAASEAAEPTEAQSSLLSAVTDAEAAYDAGAEDDDFTAAAAALGAAFVAAGGTNPFTS